MTYLTITYIIGIFAFILYSRHTVGEFIVCVLLAPVSVPVVFVQGIVNDLTKYIKQRNNET